MAAMKCGRNPQIISQGGQQMLREQAGASDIFGHMCDGDGKRGGCKTIDKPRIRLYDRSILTTQRKTTIPLTYHLDGG